jgi:hypothetical protein
MKSAVTARSFAVIALIFCGAFGGCSQQPKAAPGKPPTQGKAEQPKGISSAPKVSIQKGFSIEYRVREPKHVLDRYGFAKTLDWNEYVPWRMDAGGVIGQMIWSFDKSPDDHYVEVILLITNKEASTNRFDIDSPFVENGAEHLLSWECLPGNVVGNYAQLAKYAGLSDAAPTDENIITLNTEHDQRWQGKFYVSLQQGQKAWVELIFSLPKSIHSTKLHFGPEGWAPLDLQL